MDEQIRQDIIAILKDTIVAIEKSDVLSLDELSNHINHTSIIFQDEDSVSLAVMVYALSKVIERQEGHVDRLVLKFMKKALHFIMFGNVQKYRQAIHRIFDYIERSDHRLRMYALHVIDQAEIKRGSKLFEHGISEGRVAELLGLSRWELMNYIGKTNIADEFPETPNLKEKLDFSRRLFHLK